MASKRQVIVVDLDDTVVDVSDRIRQVLMDLGHDVEGVEDIQAYLDELSDTEMDDFYNLFLDDKYVYLDKLKKGVIDDIMKYQEEVGLPAVIITGRPETMKTTEDLVRQIKDMGLEVIDTIVRHKHTLIPAERYKVIALKHSDYDPVAIFDDDEDVLAAVKVAFPAVELFYTKGDKAIKIDLEETPIHGKAFE
jgi:hypothetical protein